MPKNGPAYPVDELWKEQVKLRLRTKRWTATQLAKEVGVTRAAISHVLGPKAIQSSLVPDIEHVLGWKPRVEEGPLADLRKKALEENGPDNKTYVGLIDFFSRMIGDTMQIELLSIYMDLDPEHRAKLHERAVVLLENQNHMLRYRAVEKKRT